MRLFNFVLLIMLLSQPLAGQNRKVVLLNRGDMYIGKNDNSVSLSVHGSIHVDSVSNIREDGAVRLYGNFISDVNGGTVFNSASKGEFQFVGDSVQYIKGGAGKDVASIDFPNLRINNQTQITVPAHDSVAVVVAPNMAVSADTLFIERGRLILESDTIDAHTSRTAHLLVYDTACYNTGGYTNKYEKGVVQVHLAAGNHFRSGRLLGFTPPFKTIYNDYFFYNFLSAPTNFSLFGNDNNMIVDPKYRLQAGRGYIVGLGIVPDDDPYWVNEWDPQWAANTDIGSRFKEKLSFARDFAPDSFTQFVNGDASISDEFTGEVLHTQDVVVDLEKGWNYLGNPFTAPLNMATFLDETSNDANPWKISRGSGPPADVQNKYYILSQGQGTYRQGLQHPFYFTVSYLVAQKVGGTVSLSEGLESTLVSPMQLFVVKKNTAGNGTMTIPASLRRHGNINYFRSAHQTEQYNQFLIQTMADEDGGYDRICVVFDQYGELASSDPYDAVKIFNGSEGVNQIYTLSTDGKQMTTSVIPYTVKTLPLYLQPAALEQHITLSTHRLNTLSNIGLLQLEDRFTGATTNLLETPQYRFVTQPGDSPDRFLLHFKLFEEINQTLASTLTENVSVYYSGSSLFVKGLSESRTGSQLVVCDMNGRTVVAKRIDTAPDFECPLSLHPGAYIVKLSGKTDCIIKKIVINH